MRGIERLLLENRISPIAGVDEAGRGACAGPLLVVALILRDPFARELAQVRDSKKLSEKQREELYEIIASHSGKDYETVWKDSDRDYWMTAQEAKDYGMIDEVLTRTKAK